MILGITGPTGSGKTTLSKHFNGLLRPTGGKIFVNGKDVASRRVSEMAREVGYVFQNPNYQLFCPTVLEEIRFGLKNLKLSDEQIKNKFGFFIEAFEYGAPPHCGVGIGIERLVMILTGTDNIKDVVAFPKTASAYCLMSDAPNTVDQDQLDFLSLEIKKD